MGNFSLPMDAQQFIPHRPPICLVDRLLEFNDCSGVVESVIKSDNIFLKNDGSLEQTAMIELIAQSCAVIRGYDDRLNGRAVKKGFLVGIRSIRFMGKAGAGDLLVTRVNMGITLGDFAVAEGTVSCRENILAAGSLKLWIPENA